MNFEKLKAKRKGKKALKEFLDEIESVTVGSEWEIQVSYILEHFGINKEEYFRFSYMSRKEVPDSYTEETAEALIELLERAGVSSAQESFAKNGYFFPEKLLEDFEDYFCSILFSRIQSLEVDRDLLETAVSASRTMESALDFYCRDVLSMEDEIAFASDLFLKERSIAAHSVSRGFLKKHLRYRFKIRQLKWEAFEAELKERLKEKAARWGISGRNSSFAEYDSIPAAKLTPELSRAFAVLGLDPESLPGEGEIRKKYRSLIKKFHPDVNPHGQEKTRTINSAFAKISVFLSEDR